MDLKDASSVRSGSSQDSVLVKRPNSKAGDSDAPNDLDRTTSMLSRRDGAPSSRTAEELCDALDNIADLDLALHPVQDFPSPGSSLLHSPHSGLVSPHESNHPGNLHKPFHKWMRTLQRRALHRGSDPGLATAQRQRHERSSRRGTAPLTPTHHRTSSSDSSFRFVVSAQSASNSMASVSMFARSRRTHLRSSKAMSKTDRSSRASMTIARVSEDSAYREHRISLDPAATQRSLQRRRILEELVNTEEAYIGDIRFLLHVSEGYVNQVGCIPEPCLITTYVGLRDASCVFARNEPGSSVDHQS
jgi:hypothetical protein